MKKVLFCVLAALALAFTACESNGPQHPIKGVKFVCDYDRGETPVREYFYDTIKLTSENGYPIGTLLTFRCTPSGRQFFYKKCRFVRFESRFVRFENAFS